MSEMKKISKTDSSFKHKLSKTNLDYKQNVVTLKTCK